MRATLLVPAISTCLLLAACGKQPDATPSTSPPPSATPSTPPAPVATDTASGKSGAGQDSESEKRESASVSAFDLDAARARIDLANQTFGDRYRKDDASWYASRYTKDACVMPPNETTICGRDAIRAYFYYGGANRDIDISVKSTDIYGGADAVIEEGNYDIPNPKGGYYDRGKFIGIWKLEDGTWKLYREIWTSSQPRKR